MTTTILAKQLPRRAAGAPVLLRRALDGFRAGRFAAPAPPAGTDAWVAKRVKEHRTRRLSPADHAALQALAGPRDGALALARAGKLADAEVSMRLARFVLSVAALTREGRAVAESLHHAAEAYLLYRRGDFDGAYARMEAALRATRPLDAGDASGFAGARGIHLVHNMMKVEVRRGATREAMELGAKLLGHLGGTTCAEPLHPAASAWPRLDDHTASYFLASVTSTLAELLAPLPTALAAALLESLPPLPEDVPYSRGREWLALARAARADDLRPFLEGAAPFLREGRGEAPVLWYAVLLDLSRAQRALDPASAAAAEIGAELSNAPAAIRPPG
jgi:hypothetical protein